MGRQRKPIALRLVEGSYKPCRHGAKPAPDAHFPPLGEPPTRWKSGLKAIWAELSATLVPGVATGHDRAAFELTCRLMDRMRSKPTSFTAAEAAQLRAALGAFGLTPSDRAKLAPPAPDKADLYF